MSSQVETFDRAVDRLNAATQAVVWTLISMVSAGLLAFGLSINDDPAGLLLLLGAILAGCFPLVRFGYASNKPNRLAVDDLGESASQLLAEASAISRRLHTLADTAEPGEVQNHLVAVARTADGEIRRLHRELRRSAALGERRHSTHRSSETNSANPSAQIFSWLVKLETAARNLAETQRSGSETQPQQTPATDSQTGALESLVEQTNELSTQLTVLRQP